VGADLYLSAAGAHTAGGARVLPTFCCRSFWRAVRHGVAPQCDGKHDGNSATGADCSGKGISIKSKYSVSRLAGMVKRPGQ
jgi:hypothetical protein